MNAAILRIGTSGRIGCLYTELIDLRSLGRLEIVRATDIRFDDATQQWEVRPADAGPGATPVFSHPSREACLRWEHENLQPAPGAGGLPNIPLLAGEQSIHPIPQ